MSVHNFVKASLLFSDVVKNNKQTYTELAAKEQVVNNHPDISNHNDHDILHRGRIVNQYRKSFQNCKVSDINTKACNDQCVSCMCGNTSNSINKRVHMNSMQENQFIHVNRFQPLSNIGCDTVNDCHAAVNTVGTRTAIKQTCNTSVACGNSVKPIEKGKNKDVLDSNCNNTLARGHGVSHKLAQHILPHSVPSKSSIGTKKRVTNVCNGTSSPLNSNIDKYALEIQNSTKSARIQEAKAAPRNKQCIKQKRPLFGFVPI